MRELSISPPQGVDWHWYAGGGGGEEFRLPQGNFVSSLALCGGQVCSGSGDGAIHVWAADRETLDESDTNGAIATQVLEGHSDAVFALAAWGGLLASGGGDRTIRVWDLETGRCAAVLRGHSDDVRALCATPPICGGNCGPLLSASEDCTARVWRWTAHQMPDADHRIVADVLVGHARGINAVALLGSTSAIAVTGSDDRTIRVWDLPAPPVVVAPAAAELACSSATRADRRVAARHVLRGHGAAVAAVAVLNCPVPAEAVGGSGPAPATTAVLVVSASVDGEMRVWDAAGWACRAIGACTPGQYIYCLAASAGELLAGTCGGADGAARAVLVWRLRRDAGLFHDAPAGTDSLPACPLSMEPLVVPAGQGDVSALLRVGGREVWGAVGSELVVWGRC